MKFNFDIEKKESVLFLRPRDRDLGPDQGEKLKELVRDKAGIGTSAVVINLGGSDYMSSVFLGALIEISKELKVKGVRLGLAQLSRKNLEIMKATKLDSIFAIFEDSYRAYTAFTDNTPK